MNLILTKDALYLLSYISISLTTWVLYNKVENIASTFFKMSKKFLKGKAFYFPFMIFQRLLLKIAFSANATKKYIMAESAHKTKVDAMTISILKT